MIKLTGTGKNGRPVIMLGLSDGNLMRLKEGKPINIWGTEINQPVDIVIFWGETEEKLAEMVKPFVGPETRVNDELTNPPRKN